MRRSSLLAALCCLAACSHSQPFSPPDTGSDIPLDPGPPARLTRNPAEDGQISFTPDGRFLIYSFAWGYGYGPARCLALLPVHRARDSRWLCPVKDPYVADGYSQPTVSAGGQVAFVLTRQHAYEQFPFYEGLLAAPLSDLRDTAEVTPIPFMTPDGVRHQGITRAVWLNEDTLAIQADGALYLADLTVRPRHLTPVALPGPPLSIEAVPAGGRLYLTLSGDSRVLVWSPAGALTTLFDFGAAAPSLVQVGNRALAVLTDSGVALVDLADGRMTPVPTYGLEIGELAFAPDGSDLIASAVDTTVSPASDLYRLMGQ